MIRAMETTKPIDQRRRGMLAIVIAITVATVIAASFYAQLGTSTNTIDIVPLGGDVPGDGAGGGGFGYDDPNFTGSTSSATLTEIGEKFESHHDDDDRLIGQVLTRIDLPEQLETGNLVMDMIWSNSIDVGGILKKPNEFLNVGLYFLDSDQREADDDDNYSGDCNENTQRSFKQDNIETWVCPDNNPLATATLTVTSAFGVLGSSIDGHNPLYVLAYIPKVEEDDDKGNGKGKGKKDGDDDGEVGSVNSGQIKQMEFVYTVISAS